MDRSSFDEEKSSFQDTDTLLAPSSPRKPHGKESSIRRRFSRSCLNCFILLLNLIIFAALVFSNGIPMSKTVQTGSSSELNSKIPYATSADSKLQNSSTLPLRWK